MGDVRAKVMDTYKLIKLAENGRRAKFNRQFDVNALSELLDPNGIHVVAWTMVHNDSEIRAQIMMKFKDNDEPQTAFFDMSFKDYNSLKEFVRHDDGTYDAVK